MSDFRVKFRWTDTSGLINLDLSSRVRVRTFWYMLVEVCVNIAAAYVNMCVYLYVHIYFPTYAHTYTRNLRVLTSSSHILTRTAKTKERM